jgi:hypothetical protein
VYNLQITVVGERKEVVADFRSTPIRIKATAESLLMLRVLAGQAEQIINAVLVPPRREIPSLSELIISEYSVAPATVVKENPVLLIDERDQPYAATQDPDAFPPLPKTVADGLKKVREQAGVSSQIARSSGSTSDYDSGGEDAGGEEEDDSQFVDADGSALPEERTPLISIVLRNAVVDLRLLEFVKRQQRLHAEEPSYVHFTAGIKSVLVDFLPPDPTGTVPRFRASLRLASLTGSSHVKGASHRALLFVDSERLKIWIRRKARRMGKGLPNNVIGDELHALSILLESRSPKPDTTFLRLQFAMHPLKIVMQQRTLMFLLSFVESFTKSIPTVVPPTARPPLPESTTFIEDLHIWPIGLKLSYDKQLGGSKMAKVNVGGYVLALLALPTLVDTPVKLQDVRRGTD